MLWMVSVDGGKLKTDVGRLGEGEERILMWLMYFVPFEERGLRKIELRERGYVESVRHWQALAYRRPPE